MISLSDSVVEGDVRSMLDTDVDWHALYGKTILVTGATGMLASYFCLVLAYLNRERDAGITIIALARSEYKLQAVFGDNPADLGVRYAVQDVCDQLAWAGQVDMVFHAAGAASAHAIVADPVGIMNANVIGTLRVLDFARAHGVSRVLFASTREVYGAVRGQSSIREVDCGQLDPLAQRSCYPESKRAAEAMLRAYSTQYGIPFVSVRIAHSYGPGMAIENDGRVMADFICDAVNDRDIRLNSDGMAERAFCYVADAVEAIFRVLISGNPNSAYNIANESDPVRILNLAEQIQCIAANGKGVRVEPDENVKGYTNYARIPLNIDRLQALGWTPRISLKEGLSRTLESIQATIGRSR